MMQQMLLGLTFGDKTYVDDLFSTFLYKGTDSTTSHNNGIDLAGEGGLVWIKNRGSNDANYSKHVLVDSERPKASNQALPYISSNNLTGETTTSAGVSNFLGNGFTITGSQTLSNSSNWDYTSWTFRKAPGFLDIVTYSGSSSVQTIPHSLGSEPGMILIKNLSTSMWWGVYHRSLATDKYLRLNETASELTSTVMWNQTRPTSTEFTVGVNGHVSGGGSNFVAYVFAHDDARFGTGGDESIIKCGTYSGNGSTTNVNLGFEPQWVLIKASDANYGWAMLDNMRGIVTGTADDRFLSANGTDEEQGQDMADLTATGFIAKANANTNANGKTYIYMAIRRPNKPPEAATDVFAIDTARGTSPSPPQFTSGFAVDLAINKPAIDGTNNWKAHSRLTGNSRMYPNNDSTEDTGNTDLFDFMDGYTNSSALDANNLAYMFKRAPGFIDVVTYTGTGSARTQNHNLGAVPELMIVKRRDSTNNWHVYSATLGATKRLTLDGTGGENIYAIWNNTAPTSTVFSMNHNAAVNGSGGTYLALLFATLPKISKVGSYSGTGNAVNVDCGFTNGARFILIKRTDNTGDWYVWDTTRGIVSGNDPYLLLNTATAQVTNTDYVDPLSTGFTVTASAPAALNASGGTYLFLAIA